MNNKNNNSINERTNWTKEKLLIEANKYKSRNEFKNECRKAYDAARRKGMLDEICTHMPKTLKSKVNSINDVKIEALKYKTRSEFWEKSNTEYQYAVKHKIIDEVCSHMKKFSKSKTDEELFEIALSYNSRSDFYRNKPAAYQMARRKGILDDIFKTIPKKINLKQRNK